MRRYAIGVLLGLALVAVALVRVHGAGLVRESFILMDTYVDFVLPKKDRGELKELLALARDLEGKLSFYRGGSCVARLNREGWISSSDPCYPVLKDVIGVSKEVCEESGGAFDPGYGGKASVMEIEVLEEGIRAPEGGRYDFSGVAKGYIVDRLIKEAREAGIEFLMVNAGGDVGLFDRRGVGVWVEVRNPLGRGPLDRVRLRKGAIATSGTYERGGHIWDPRLRRKVGDLVSASCYGPNCALADAWATAVYVLGLKGLEVSQRNGIGALVAFLGAGGRVEVKANAKWLGRRRR